MASDPSHRLKFQRAEQHLEELNLKVQAWLSEGQNKATLEPDPDDTECQLLTIERADIPDEKFSLLIGDIVQNLRASLDHLVFELGQAHLGEGKLTEKQTTGSKFPIIGYKDPNPAKAFENAAKVSLTAVSPTARAAIEGLQPYRFPRGTARNTDWLLLLHEMAIADKHRVLHTASVTVPRMNLSLAYAPGRSGVRFDQSKFLDSGELVSKTGAPAIRFPVIRDRDGGIVKMDLTPTFDLALQDFPTSPVLQLLGRLMLKVALEVFPRLEPFL